jgi:hypothetical protein
MLTSCYEGLYLGEHGPKVPVTTEYIVLQQVLQNGSVCQF